MLLPLKKITQMLTSLTVLLGFLGLQNIHAQSIDEKLQKNLGKYNISIYTGSFQGSDYAKRYCTWENLTEADEKPLEKYANILIEEWSKYPIEWVKKSNLKAIALVKKLAVSSQYRAAMPDAYGEVLYLDITYLANGGEDYVREVIHHEYYHMLEENYFGDFYYKDPQWNALNHPDYPYVSSQGANAYTDGLYKEQDHPAPGFVSAYSRYALEEDKADMYAYLMTTKRFEQLQNWIKEDTYLASKTKYMMNFMKKNCSEMNAQWFSEIHNLKSSSKPVKIKPAIIQEKKKRQNKK
jgi:hypothetical protein